MSTISLAALAALNRTRNANSADEIPGAGPAWACERFGHYGHVSIACSTCTGNFMSQDDNDKGATK